MLSPLEINPAVYCRTWDGGAILNGSNEVTQLTDLTGNGNHLLPQGTNPITIVSSGIGTKDAVVLDGTNYLAKLGALTGFTQSNIGVMWAVYKITDTLPTATFPEIANIGHSSYTVAGYNYQRAFLNTGSTAAYTKYPNPTANAAKASVSPLVADFFITSVVYEVSEYISTLINSNGTAVKTLGVGTSMTFNHTNIFLGGWKGSNIKMQLCEFGAMDNISIEDRQKLTDYLIKTYSI